MTKARTYNPAPVPAGEPQPAPPDPGERAGLCASCRHQKVVRNTRGSAFSMCLRAREDPRYAKYPPLPVLRCPGHEPLSAGDDPAGPAPRDAG